MSNYDDQRTGSINLSLKIDSRLAAQQSSLTSPLLNDYEVVKHEHTKHSLDPDKSPDRTSAGNFKSTKSLNTFVY